MSVEALPKHLSTLGRQSIDMLVACRSRVDRVTIDISTDASVDVSVEVRYKIHDPKVLPSCKRQNGSKTTTALVIFDPRNASARS